MKCNPTRESSCSFLNHSIKLVYEPADVVFVLSTPVQLIFPSTMNVVKELIVLSSKEEFCARLIYFFFVLNLVVLLFNIPSLRTLLHTHSSYSEQSESLEKILFFFFFLKRSTLLAGVDVV